VVRALALFSGSLASRVAARVVERSPQVDELFLLHFRSPLFGESALLRELVKEEWPGVNLRTQSLKKDYRRMVNIPPQGHFSLKRSCLSCRTLILMRAVRYMERIHADFIVTGEVVGRNGLSAQDLMMIEQTLGITGLVLRPLSARLLPLTRAEQAGWVKRDDLFGFREGDPIPWARLADQFGLISTIDQLGAENRCKLTFPGFGKRLETLFKEGEFTMNSLKLLDFRLYYIRPPDIKIVLATSEEEKRTLQNFFLPPDLRVYLPVYQGAMTLVRTDWEGKTNAQVREIIELAGRITATYSNAPAGSVVQVNFRFERDDETSQINVPPFSSPQEITRYCFLHQLQVPKPKERFLEKTTI